MTRHLRVALADQELSLWDDDRLLVVYPVSTALQGPGSMRDSGCTPTGRHRIRLKIGDNCPLYTVFRARRPTGEIYTPELGRQFPDRDWILTRILWLSGLEPGINRGSDCDTLKRFIYIHGTAEESLLGTPVSHGCIRMNSHDLIELFDAVSNGTIVTIE
ncbi:MAG TPA: L,D-transpeptidase [Thiolapillus brandeum]|uniref:L,D-transpeptidase n=1 Tax=Thiolapillus brandeum TaxID=1076588 RepID=A0A831RY64_9GAMM|nr:L,D-transpeptidase [Thiolapillus brandeum]